MRLRTIFASLAILVFSTSVAFADTRFNQVKPNEFDPAKSHLVQGAWLAGIGCPTEVKAQVFQPPNYNTTAEETITDPACSTGDGKDKHTEGLLLAKTGPTANNASATAELKGVKGITLTELGYDIRKTAAGDARGSHCGAGAPRFNVETSDGLFGIGCNSPPADSAEIGTGWLRLRWGGTCAPACPLMGFKDFVTLAPVTGDVKSITIIFDEGQDALGAPDNFGLAVLDNIDVNGTLIGRGPTDAD